MMNPSCPPSTSASNLFSPAHPARNELLQHENVIWPCGLTSAGALKYLPELKNVLSTRSVYGVVLTTVACSHR